MMNSISLTPHLPYTPIKTLDLSRIEKLNEEVEAFLASGGEIKELKGFEQVQPKTLKVKKSKNYQKQRPKPMPGNRFFTEAEAAHIREFAHKNGITILDLSERLGFARYYFTDRFNYKSAVKPNDMKRILKFVGYEA